MKKIVALFVALVALFVVSIASADANIYARVGVIYEINYEEDFFVVEDSVGFLWEYNGVEDFNVGDVVAMMMADIEGTPSILDDVILSVTFSGYVAADVTK